MRRPVSIVRWARLAWPLSASGTGTSSQDRSIARKTSPASRSPARAHATSGRQCVKRFSCQGHSKFLPVGSDCQSMASTEPKSCGMPMTMNRPPLRRSAACRIVSPGR